MQKIQFDYFTGMEAEQYSFYRVPKVLFTKPCFKTLSCEAKVLYGLMLDRMSLSIKNRWLDSEDRVYIIFTVEEIAELMNCGTQKAVKLVKELDSSNGIGLIEKKRLGLGKPNVIYVKNFMIREVPDQKPTGDCADLQSEQEEHKKIADLQSKQKRHEECADLQQEAENKGKTGISLNCENHHSGVVKTTIQDYGESQFQNSENHNSRMVETTNPEFPESQFQNSENHHSRIVEITNPECPKSQSNNTDINKFLSKNKHLNINGEILNISKDSHYKESIGEGIYDFYSYNIIILPDNVCKDLTLAETNFLANLNNQMSYKDAVNFESKYIEKWFKENNRYLIEKYSKEFDITSSIIDGRVKSSETNNILNMTLAMRILGVYLCIVLLTISFTVLALGQLTDSIEHKDRYKVLRKLGVEENDINKIVLKQISIYFVVPIAIALIGVGIFIYNYYLMYKEIIVTFIGFNLFIFSIATGIILTICVYMCYFAGTYYTFKRNIK